MWQGLGVELFVKGFSFGFEFLIQRKRCDEDVADSYKSGTENDPSIFVKQKQEIFFKKNFCGRESNFVNERFAKENKF